MDEDIATAEVYELRIARGEINPVLWSMLAFSFVMTCRSYR
jgi:hypothetical protein